MIGLRGHFLSLPLLKAKSVVREYMERQPVFELGLTTVEYAAAVGQAKSHGLHFYFVFALLFLYGQINRDTTRKPHIINTPTCMHTQNASASLMHTHTHTHTTHTHTHIHTHTHTHTDIHTHPHIHTRTHLYANKCICIAHSNAHTHAHTHTHTDTHTLSH
jgi:hypothetical protein